MTLFNLWFLSSVIALSEALCLHIMIVSSGRLMMHYIFGYIIGLWIMGHISDVKLWNVCATAVFLFMFDCCSVSFGQSEVCRL